MSESVQVCTNGPSMPTMPIVATELCVSDFYLEALRKEARG